MQITSVGGSYDSSAEVLTANVTVKNLMQEAIGTPDGTMTAPNGIRVFFSTGPTVQTGAGSVSVANPDGYAFFTAADQPYFTYSEILDKNEVSAAKTWQFDVPTTVGTFTFTLLVQTEVQYLLVINEVLTNPGGAISDVNGEWFEIYNAGTLGVDLQGLVIADSAASGRRPYHVIASSINVPSGGYAVLGAVVDTVINGGADVDYAYGSALALANSVDALKISRVYGTDTLTLDRVSYLNAAVSAQNGISRELKNPALDNANMDGSNWADASATAVYGAAGRGTPRAQNSAYVP
ncbi:lamin tail domain-containing protein [Longimicrobium sp.]|uniref:lamin tail domain-containing protein n=1 Tax=Longimicrobium sp. TaxID=2029185 RepID=UPI002E34F87A|nr:lamin tail domain-containing protein [Longimicrobium sp.]HEX6041943.1 lamin tail domain-containing protein [Longimicrobium sp.]